MSPLVCFTLVVTEAERDVLEAVRKLAVAYTAHESAIEAYRHASTGRGPEYQVLQRTQKACGEARDALDRLIEMRAGEIAAAEKERVPA